MDLVKKNIMTVSRAGMVCSCCFFFYGGRCVVLRTRKQALDNPHYLIWRAQFNDDMDLMSEFQGMKDTRALSGAG